MFHDLLFEVATFPVGYDVFLVDSGYHVFVEGSVAGLIVAVVHQRFSSSPTQ